MSNPTRITIAIDNGVNGSIAVLGGPVPFFRVIPTKIFAQGKAGKTLKRIDHGRLDDLLIPYADAGDAEIHAFIERPFTGSHMMIKTTVLGARAFEAVLIVLEQAGIAYTVVDSKEWQADQLPGVKGSDNLKLAGCVLGVKLYRNHATTIHEHGDADALLMARYYHKRP